MGMPNRNAGRSDQVSFPAVAKGKSCLSKNFRLSKVAKIEMTAATMTPQLDHPLRK
jgi:hypothetical protein